MKLDRDVQRVLSVVGIILAFVAGMLVEYTGHVVVADPTSSAGMIVVVLLAIIVFGMVTFSEHE